MYLEAGSTATFAHSPGLGESRLRTDPSMATESFVSGARPRATVGGERAIAAQHIYDDAAFSAGYVTLARQARGPELADDRHRPWFLLLGATRPAL